MKVPYEKFPHTKVFMNDAECIKIAKQHDVYDVVVLQTKEKIRTYKQPQSAMTVSANDDGIFIFVYHAGFRQAKNNGWTVYQTHDYIEYIVLLQAIHNALRQQSQN